MSFLYVYNRYYTAHLAVAGKRPKKVWWRRKVGRGRVQRQVRRPSSTPGPA